jgi:hypothetical protein
MSKAPTHLREILADQRTNGRNSKPISASGSMPKYSLQFLLSGFYCKFCRVPFSQGLTFNSSDIAFYGINLNQSVILARIGYTKGATPYDTLYKTAVGNIIMQSAVSIQESGPDEKY